MNTYPQPLPPTYSADTTDREAELDYRAGLATALLVCLIIYGVLFGAVVAFVAVTS